MSPRRRRLIKPMQRNGTGGYFADIREYTDVLSVEERKKARYFPLLPPVEIGETTTRPTRDHDEAKTLLKNLLKALQQRRRDGVKVPEAEAKTGPWTVARAADEYLKYRAKRIPEKAYAYDRLVLTHVLKHVGGHRLVRELTVHDVGIYIDALRASKTSKGSPFSERTCQKYLGVFGKMLKFCQGADVVERNVVSLSDDRPGAGEGDSRFLEPHTAALLLEACWIMPVRPSLRRASPIDCMHALMATWLLTGVRNAEGVGLRIRDVNLGRGLLYIAPNKGRRALKNKSSTRQIPMPPQLTEILTVHIAGREAQGATGDDLLFVRRGGQTIGDWADEFRGVARYAGLLDADIQGTIDGATVDSASPKLTRKTWATASRATTNREALRIRGGWATNAMLDSVYSQNSLVDVPGPELAFKTGDYLDRVPGYADRVMALWMRLLEPVAITPRLRPKRVRKAA